MSNATDDEILTFAAGKQAILVTLDADFHTMLAVSGKSRPSVIRIRIQGLRAPEASGLLRKVLIAFAEDLHKGALISVKARKTTCHRLPIGSSS